MPRKYFYFPSFVIFYKVYVNALNKLSYYYNKKRKKKKKGRVCTRMCRVHAYPYTLRGLNKL